MTERLSPPAASEAASGHGDRRTPKEEQEPASDAVTEVAPGVLRMQLPLQFTGLGHVNMYGLTDATGLAVVDPGMPGQDAWRDVVHALRQAGYRPKDVHTVVVTHAHPDHFGGAARLAAEASASVIAYEGFAAPWAVHDEPDVLWPDDDEPLVLPSATGPVTGSPGRLRVPWRAKGDTMAPPPLHGLVPGLRTGQDAPDASRPYLEAPTITRSLTDGDRIRLAGRDWFAVHTPGHTADHVCLVDPEHRVLLAGDHVLPTITPHVSGIGCGPDSLKRYLASLATVAQLDVDQVLPAHGHPFRDLAGRSRQIAHHHYRRLARLREIGSAGGPMTVEAFTRELFGTAQNGLLAESEVFAHLEHLRLGGSATFTRVNGALVYDLRGGAESMPGGGA